MRNYQRLDIETFGRHLLDSGDLDPMYTALVGACPDLEHRKRWLVAYWSLYHCGAACYLSEKTGADFWGHLMEAAENLNPAPTGGRWPRGHERRHWRAKNAINATYWMQVNFATPERFVNFVSNDGAGGRFAEIATRAKTVPSNGPWIAFKIADTLERCLGIPVDFTEAEVFLFDTPKEAAITLWRDWHSFPPEAKPKDVNAVISGAVNYLAETFKEYSAPPHGDRALGLQELETILCKWKSHLNGSYPLNNDIIDIRHGMEPWLQHSNTAAMFLQHMPRPL